MNCADVRPFLGEHLVEALDLPVETQVRSHLSGCAPCRAELEELRRLEGALADLGIARRRPGFRPGLAAAAVLLVAGAAALGWLALRGGGDVSIREGALQVAGREVRAGGRCAFGQRIVAVATGEAVFGLSASVEVRAVPGTSMLLHDAGRVEIDRGAATFEVAAAGRGFKVETPRGTVETAGTSFQVVVEDPDMNRGLVIGGSAAVVSVAVIAGVVLFNPRDGAREGVRVSAGESLRAAPDSLTLEPAAPSPEARALATLEVEATALRKQIETARAENAKLREALQASEAERQKLRAEIDAGLELKGDTLARVMGAFDSLRTKGAGGFLEPGVKSQMVTDLKSLGDEGTDLCLGWLKSEDEEARFLAANLLESLSDPRTVLPLRDAALHDKSESVASMASHALALMDHPAALDPLREIVERTTFEGVKVNSMFGVMKQGDQKGYEMVLDYVKNKENSIQMRAAIAPGVFIMTDPRTLAIADECVSQFAKHDALMDMAVTYYKNLRTPEGRLRLQGMVNDTRFSEAIRKAAAVALGQ